MTSDSGSDHTTPGDSTTDQNVTNEGGGQDQFSDGGTDSSDGTSPSDADADSGPGFDAAALRGLANQANIAYCKRIAFCCDGADAAAFDLAFCVSNLAEFGGIAGLNRANVDDGRLGYNATAAANCIADQAAFSCGTFTSAEYTQMLKDCSQAVVGTVAIGGACTGSWDCAPPSYCAGAGGVALDPVYAGPDSGLSMGDGGTGTCKELIAVGQPCTDYIYNTDCSYLGNGTPQNYCTILGDGGPGVCTADITNGNACIFNSECVSQICDGVTGDCQPSTVFSDPGTPGGICASYAFPDAGDGG